MRKLGLSLVATVAMSTAVFAGEMIEEEPKAIYTPPPVETSGIEISANMTLASKYIWRGQNQISSKNDMAIQGGIDVEYKGFYLSAWASNVDFDGDDNLELDIYGGYRGEVAGIGYDIGYIAYFLPNTYVDFDTTGKEVYLGLSKEIGNFGIGGTYSYNPDAETYNLQLDASVKTFADITIAGSYGMMDGTDDTYYAIGASKTFGKFDVAVTYTGTKMNNSTLDQDHIVASISTSF